MSRTRWLSIALFVSVALNLALAGVIAAQTWRMRDAMHGGGRGPEALARQLSPASGEKARALMRSRRAEATELFATVRQARGEARAALAAEPLDDARLTRAMDRLRQANEALQRHIQAGFVELARQLPREDREKLSRMMPGGEPRERRPRRDAPPAGSPPAR